MYLLIFLVLFEYVKSYGFILLFSVWYLVFRGMAGIGTSIYDTLLSGAEDYMYNEFTCESLLNCSGHYRNNSLWNNWSVLGITKVIIQILPNLH